MPLMVPMMMNASPTLPHCQLRPMQPMQYQQMPMQVPMQQLPVQQMPMQVPIQQMLMQQPRQEVFVPEEAWPILVVCCPGFMGAGHDCICTCLHLSAQEAKLVRRAAEQLATKEAQPMDLTSETTMDNLASWLQLAASYFLRRLVKTRSV